MDPIHLSSTMRLWISSLVRLSYFVCIFARSSFSFAFISLFRIDFSSSSSSHFSRRIYSSRSSVLHFIILCRAFTLAPVNLSFSFFASAMSPSSHPYSSSRSSIVATIASRDSSRDSICAFSVEKYLPTIRLSGMSSSFAIQPSPEII